MRRSQMMPRSIWSCLSSIGQPDLGELAVRTRQRRGRCISAAAQEMIHRRELLLARLRERAHWRWKSMPVTSCRAAV